ncbi:MAG: hypothetical protein WB807_12815 [Candidatus Dormiibacterota bacterium]
MMNSSAFLDLARERSRDLIDDARRSRRHRRNNDRNLPASEVVFLFGRSAHEIDARVRAQARLRVEAAAADHS